MTRTICKLGAVVALGILGGCATYMEQRADLAAGGPQKRIDDANQRLALAQDEQASLGTTIADEREYLAYQQDQLARAERNVARQRERLADARAADRISAEQERALGGRLENATADYEAAVLGFQSETAAGNEVAAERKRRELTTLQEEIERINREIKILSR